MNAEEHHEELLRTYRNGGDVSLAQVNEAYYRAYPEERPVTYTADDSLAQRIRDRIGKPDAKIEVREEEWDFGFCDTCSYPEDGFSVYADGEQVWPDEKYLASVGGVSFADDQGNLEGTVLTVYGEFNEWLNGKDDWDND